MRKVLIIGPGGAGKSTLAGQLGRLLNIEVLHLDKFYWHSGWIETTKSEWLETVEKLLGRDAWIMDGNYSGTLEVRYGACDTIIFLDISRTICLWRVLKRTIKYRRRSRPDMADGCDERLTLEFIFWIWNYRHRTRPKIVRMFESSPVGKRSIWLRSPSDVERFLAEQGTPNNTLNPSPR